MTESKRRFTFHDDLTDDTPFMGATVGEWHAALTGHGAFQRQLDVLKARLAEREGQPPIALPAEAQDMGSRYKKIKMESAAFDAPRADDQS